MLFMTYDTARSSRNADFISIAPKGETTHYILRVASAPSKCVRCAPQSGNPLPFEPSYNMFGRGRLEDLSLLDLSPLQHEHAFGIMVIGAIEDIPLNHV